MDFFRNKITTFFNSNDIFIVIKEFIDTIISVIKLGLNLLQSVDQLFEINVFIIIILTLILFILPNILTQKSLLVRLARFIPVLIHEFGHAIVCQATGGRTTDIVIVLKYKDLIKYNQLGYAHVQPRGWIGKFLTAAAGYITPALLLFWFTHLLTINKASIIFIIILIMVLYWIIMTSKKIIPLLLLIILSLSGVGQVLNDNVFTYYMIFFIIHFVISALIAEMLMSSIDIIKVWWSKNNQWDGAILSRMTFLPQIVFVLMFVIIDLSVLYLFIKFLI